MARGTDTNGSAKGRFFDQQAGNWDESRGAEQDKIGALLDDLGLGRGWLVLEPGCGTGIISRHILRRIGSEGGLLGLDISRDMLTAAADKKLSPRAIFCRADAAAVPLRSALADAVVCFRVFPHLADRQAAMAEFNRVLKRRGRLDIVHPAGSERINALHERAGGAVANDRIPPEAEMRRLFADFGFEIELLDDREERYLLRAVKRKSLVPE